MKHAIEHLAGTLRAARLRRSMSQRHLAGLAGVPQSHISKIENGLVDPRISTVVELGRALGVELIFVPRKALPAVKAVVRSIDEPSSDTGEPGRLRPAYRLEGDDD